MTTRVGASMWFTLLTVVILSTALVQQASANDTAAILGGIAAGYLTYRLLDRDNDWNRPDYQTYPYVQPVAPWPQYYVPAQPDWHEYRPYSDDHGRRDRDDNRRQYAPPRGDYGNFRDKGWHGR